VTTDLVQQSDSWVEVLGPVGDLAARLSKTQFVPKALQGNPAATAAAILTGREMGLGPMASLRGIDVVEGRPALTSQMLAARIYAAGHSIEWRVVSDKAVTVRITRGDGLGEAEATWTIADAQRAGLAGKKVWQSYPRHMLRARALGEAAAMACPDVALGLDVLADTTTGDAEPSRGPVTVVALHAEPEPEAEPELVVVAEHEQPEQRLISVPQMRKLRALLRDLAAATGRPMDPDAAREHISGLAGRALGSAKDLTSNEASRVIDLLGEQVAEAASAPVDAEIIEEGEQE
jgi:hypothetical protein